MSDVQSALLTFSLLAIISLHPCYLPCPCHRHHTIGFGSSGYSLQWLESLASLETPSVSLFSAKGLLTLIITIITVTFTIIIIRITLTKYKRSPPSNIYWLSHPFPSLLFCIFYSFRPMSNQLLRYFSLKNTCEIIFWQIWNQLWGYFSLIKWLRENCFTIKSLSQPNLHTFSSPYYVCY